jgi:putative DNA methylase
MPKNGCSLWTERKHHDSQIGGGTVNRSGATCPNCGAIKLKVDMKLDGKENLIGSLMTAVVINGNKGKEYRLPSELEMNNFELEKISVLDDFQETLITEDAKQSTWCVSYGLDTFDKLFNSRQLSVLKYFSYKTKNLPDTLTNFNYSETWSEAICAYLAIAVDRIADYNSSLCHWHLREYIVNTFQRFALPMNWDYCEIPVISDFTGGYQGAIEWISLVIAHTMDAFIHSNTCSIMNKSAKELDYGKYDVIATDPTLL